MSPFLLGVSLSSRDRVLGRTLVYSHGEASGFFCVWKQSRAKDSKKTRGSPMSTSICSLSYILSQIRIPQKGCSTHLRALYFLVSVLSMSFGGIIYLIWRPTTLLMFSWCKIIGVYGVILQMRSVLGGMKEYLPVWFIYSLPQALWCFSGLCSIHAIWINNIGNHERFWIIFTFMLPFLTEFLQLLHVIPGTFDFVDLIFIIASFCLFDFLTHISYGGNNNG